MRLHEVNRTHQLRTWQEGLGHVVYLAKAARHGNDVIQEAEHTTLRFNRVATDMSVRASTVCGYLTPIRGQEMTLEADRLAMFVPPRKY